MDSMVLNACGDAVPVFSINRVTNAGEQPSTAITTAFTSPRRRGAAKRDPLPCDSPWRRERPCRTMRQCLYDVLRGWPPRARSSRWTLAERFTRQKQEHALTAANGPRKGRRKFVGLEGGGEEEPMPRIMKWSSHNVAHSGRGGKSPPFPGRITITHRDDRNPGLIIKPVRIQDHPPAQTLPAWVVSRNSRSVHACAGRLTHDEDASPAATDFRKRGSCAPPPTTL